jgi:prolipoprotein diacylglyceryltransferase
MRESGTSDPKFGVSGLGLLTGYIYRNAKLHNQHPHLLRLEESFSSSLSSGVVSQRAGNLNNGESYGNKTEKA